jgi:hypothetical protein
MHEKIEERDASIVTPNAPRRAKRPATSRVEIDPGKRVFSSAFEKRPFARVRTHS